MNRPTLWAEGFMGTFAVGLCLIGGLSIRPPCPWQGAKGAYREAILAALGLAPGQGADRVLGVDLSPWADVWPVLSDTTKIPGILDQLQAWASIGDQVEWAKRVRLAYSDDPIAWLWITSRSWSGRGPAAGFKREIHTHGHRNYPLDHPTKRIRPLADLNWPPAVFHRGDCLAFPWPEDLTGAVIYFDPPYQKTTGYQAGGVALEELIGLSRELSRRGAVVAISEGEPVQIEGWTTVDLSAQRFGIGGRTFSAQTAEFMTYNRRWIDEKGDPCP